MKNDVDQTVLAARLESALDPLVEAGVIVVKLTEGADPRDKEAALYYLEERAVQLIQKVIKSVKPESSNNLEERDARSIWKTFWELQQKPEEQKESIIALLAKLTSNPNWTPALA